MKKYYQKPISDVFDEFHASSSGLSSQEAHDRLQQYGKNALKEAKKKSVIHVFLEQFLDLLVVILIIAAVISLISGNLESTIVIFVVIILNAVLGTIQHFKAEKSLSSLKALSSPMAKVIRDGQKIEIASQQLVPGDILLLEAGDFISADGRVIETYSLQVNESSLTGESTNVEKNKEPILSDKVALGDQKNMVFSGSLVTYGRADVVVTNTGMHTEIGKIAALMNDTQQKKTPLQVSLDKFSQKLAMIIILICFAVFLLSLYRHMPILDSLMFAVALAVAAIPEALSSIVTIVLAMGTQRMAKENAIMKVLKAVESLGCVSVICSDKTGTLTQNKMTVQTIYADGAICTPKQLTIENPVHQYLLYTALLTNDSVLSNGKGIGDPTEYSLLEMGTQIGLIKESLSQQYPRIEELPFDSDRKLMSTKHKIDNSYVILTKGAVDVLLNRTTHISTSSGIRTFTDADKSAIVKVNQEMSENGLRVLAFCCRTVSPEQSLTMEEEYNYTFLGLISMMDPPREESKKAVADAKQAGIRPIMITGDHKVTACAIAKSIGIFENGDTALTGSELDDLSESALMESLEKISVYARVSPEHKIRIVHAWQKKGNIVAMTGDGVNDAPALKKADIGIAMGITGTEVSKDAAAMILSDDNFSTIVKAVMNGRNVYNNIKHSIQFLLSGNTAGILSVLYTSLFALPIPFAPVHLLFINLLTDSLPAIAIGMEPAQEGLLDQKPRDPKEPILTKSFLLKIAAQGGLIALFTMLAYHIGLRTGSSAASTMAFATLALARLFHGFNCRGGQSIFRLGFRSNMYSIYAFLAGLLLLNSVLLIPGLHTLFSVATLTINQFGWIYLLAFLPTVILQLVKIVRERA